MDRLIEVPFFKKVFLFSNWKPLWSFYSLKFIGSPSSLPGFKSFNGIFLWWELCNVIFFMGCYIRWGFLWPKVIDDRILWEKPAPKVAPVSLKGVLSIDSLNSFSAEMVMGLLVLFLSLFLVRIWALRFSSWF